MPNCVGLTVYGPNKRLKTCLYYLLPVGLTVYGPTCVWAYLCMGLPVGLPVYRPNKRLKTCLYYLLPVGLTVYGPTCVWAYLCMGLPVGLPVYRPNKRLKTCLYYLLPVGLTVYGPTCVGLTVYGPTCVGLTRDLRPVSTKLLNRRLTYIRKLGLVDMGFLPAGQQTRLGPSRPTDGWLWPTTPVRKDGQIGSVDTGLNRHG